MICSKQARHVKQNEVVHGGGGGRGGAAVEAVPLLPRGSRLAGNQATAKLGYFLLKAHQPKTTKQAKQTKEEVDHKIRKAIPYQ